MRYEDEDEQRHCKPNKYMEGCYEWPEGTGESHRCYKNQQNKLQEGGRGNTATSSPTNLQNDSKK